MLAYAKEEGPRLRPERGRAPKAVPAEEAVDLSTLDPAALIQLRGARARPSPCPSARWRCATFQGVVDELEAWLATGR